MLRSLAATAALILVASGSTASAQHHHPQGHTHTQQHQHQHQPHHPHRRAASPAPAFQAFGFSFGGFGTQRGLAPYQNPNQYPIYNNFGYVFDPYERGSFDVPDLMDDPFIQRQYKFDSHFPGRYGGTTRFQRHQSMKRNRR